jgi:predicted O-methyltransferase YrrM
LKSQFPFEHPEIEEVLTRLHEASRRDTWRLVPRIPRYIWASLRNRLTETPGQHPLFRDLYSAVTEERGALLYLMARAIQAKRVVEFGSSFGISTIYLATAVRDNLGQGSNASAQVVGSEMEPEKCSAATKNLAAAGLSGIATILQGDALQTLAAVDAPVELVFLDGRKDLYLPVLKLLQPKLRPGAVILADNIHSFEKQVASYVHYVQSEKSGFVSSTLKISDWMEFSVFERTEK